MARSAASAKGRSALASALRTKVADLLKVYEESSAGGGDRESGEQRQRALKVMVNESLSGTFPKQAHVGWFQGRKTMMVLVCMDGASFERKLEEIRRPAESESSKDVNSPPRLAVAHFDNLSKAAEFSPLSRGLSEMLVTSLAASKGLVVVERARLNEILAELKLQRSPFIDTSTASQLGRGLGAGRIITGSFLVHQDVIRVECRVVDVASGQVQGAVSAKRPTAEWFELQDVLEQKLFEALGIPTKSAQTVDVRSRNFGAFASYSNGLVAMDAGRPREAASSFQRALDQDPKFGVASTALEGLRARAKDMFEELDRSQRRPGNEANDRR